MISELKQGLFVSLAQASKKLSKENPLPTHKKHISVFDESLQNLSIKNQRRIARLREKKDSNTTVIKLLRQEVREHNLTRDQLQASIDYLKHEHDVYKQTTKKNSAQLQLLIKLKKQLHDVTTAIASLPVDDAESIQLQSKVVSLASIIKQKEKEFSL